jgi:hypothetical protein
MLRFFKKVSQLINSCFRKEVVLSELDINRLLALHKVVSVEGGCKKNIDKAIDRVKNQLGDNISYTKKKTSVVLGADDIESLKMLVHSYCIEISEKYGKSEGVLAYFLSKQYEFHYNLMLRIR